MRPWLAIVIVACVLCPIALCFAGCNGNGETQIDEYELQMPLTAPDLEVE